MRKWWISGLAMALGGCAAGGGHGPQHMGGPPPGGPGPGGYDRLFISPMGEPFRMRQPDKVWFDTADTDHDGTLSPEEFRADAARFFAVLDRGHDGEIDPDDIDYYEGVLAPEIRVGERGGGGGMQGRPGGGGGRGRRGGGGPGGGGGGDGQGMSNSPGGFSYRSGGTPPKEGRQGAGRFAYLEYPEPIIVADRNFNRGIDTQEWARAADDRFALLDRNGDGRITHAELPPIGGRRDSNGRPVGD